MIYRSSITPVERQGSAGSLADFEGMRDYYKRAALTEAENFTYIMKLAKEQGITVSDEEINKAFDEHRTAGGTERSKESFRKTSISALLTMPKPLTVWITINSGKF